MKKLLLALALVSCNALADSWAMKNDGGGQIVLTDRKCQGYKSLFYAYTYTGRTYSDGCWTILDGKVHVVWEDKARRVYNISDFAPETTNKKGGSL